jgi:hypothetical protein
MNDYIILNKKTIEKKIKELESEELSPYSPGRSIWIDGSIKVYKNVLANSIPLLSELEKAYFEGECFGIGTDACLTKEEYLANLKLKL